MGEDYPFKHTQYFLSTRERADRAVIELHWIESVNRHPFREETQSDGRIRRWGYITEAERYLRVVLPDDGETIHNAFFDRSFKP